MGQPVAVVSATQVLRALRGHGVVPVVRFTDGAEARRAVELLHDAGFRTFEVTLTVPDAIDLVRELAARPDVLVGLGTVLEPSDAARGLAAGARYVVSPVLRPDLVPLCREAGAACLLGALTPTEVYAAHQAGADAVKVFPSSAVGGPAHLRALRSVFPDVALVPTGGVDLANLDAHLDAGAAFVGVGSDLVPNAALRSGDDDAVRVHARAYLDAFRRRAPRTPQEVP
jgi:2-dehydro-3-deoxyphosphogluconate aldolase/(4S)-4-hydroxy-2-oxoglutarate aldolase